MSISLFDTLLHRVLRIPYALRVQEFQSPKKPKETIVFLHGIGNTSDAWKGVAKRLPKNTRLIGIDLLGFGQSPRPHWARYNAKTQARSVGATLLKYGIARKVTFVGHSLGALVAVEVARRYPFIVKQLVLANPPFYQAETEVKSKWSADLRLRRLYRLAQRFPDTFSSLASLAVKLRVANTSLTITQENIATYMATLESSIINQTSLYDVARLTVPITIVYGSFDPVVITKHITKLAKQQQNVTARKLFVGHEITGVYIGLLAKEIESAISDVALQRK